ncbi:hypothetical protein [Mycobacteroides abscessus]|uniref:hypothetical protein n=1 Tax=Mycobacteroides abscessus TaxID=36809 RepID=UPI00092CCDA2|nr:hypothetical protein [Mycobacteroides abscessus]MBE5516569.1 hypothetical protein [Mycobacteroides abscessus]MBN7512475.1 hypothetical protein [Mycobacteroides abscessus subsp. massiliense]MBN7530522.1 hypothetical protein [Mycobacteroides abscessus subsp. abscessus]MBN7563415.1 hypothetical protein [Mycobacteroides abscessus subsp. massiliense]MDO3027377.1 hypothetical protein [Mycobacteroides abscessus subsp. abscessus]
MEIRGSAYKHGFEDEDILHAWRNQTVFVLLEYKGVLQYLAIGPARNGAPLELIIPTDDPKRIIHCDNLREKFYKYL